jgi:prepilin signal peptidase PulO-like enzyme (type II secretory pathway)
MGRSHCLFCKKQIAWFDNIPVLSYLFLWGKCRHCRRHFSIQYMLVELATGLLFFLAFVLRFSLEDIALGGVWPSLLDANFVGLLRDWFIIAAMVVVFIYDLRWYMILDKVMMPAIVIVFLFNTYLGFIGDNFWDNLWKILISGIIGGSFFLFQFVVSRGRWIGGGDIRLGLFMGLALGYPHIFTALTIAYIMGAVVGLGLIAVGQKKLGSKMPFGVFLSTATLIVIFFGPEILKWYLRLSFY